ncbi:MAG: sensory box histidine kinase/response regulator [Chitinophagaceae bacterium]|nr:sensory box histidine kinase/response regulator [Chitinophagaceae bacterium]
MDSLLTKNAFFHVLISNIPQSLLFTDEHRKIVVANQQFCDMFHFVQGPDELTGRSGIEVLGEMSNQMDDFINQANEIDKILKEKKARYNDLMIMTDGRMLVRDFVPIHYNNQFIGHVWLFRDETEKIMSEQLVNQQKLFYEDILNSLPADIAVFSPEHKYLFLNPVAVRDEELRKWLIGKTDIDYCILRGKDMSIAERRRSIFKRIIESKKDIEWEEIITNREGELEYHLRRMTPVYNEENVLKLLIGYGMNITEIKKIQEKIALSEKRYRDLFNYSQAIICTHDMEGNFLSVNPALCEVMDYPEDEILGKNLKQFMLPEDRDGFDELYLSSLTSNKKVRGLFRVVNNKGRKVYLLYQNYCVEESGSEPYVIGFAQDVTDRIKIEKQLKEAKKLTEESAKTKERFLANMSHEIRTPMNGILGITTLLQKTQLNDEQKGFLRIVEDSAQNLLNIINDILDLEKIGSGNIQLEKVPFNISERLDMLIRFFQINASQKKILLTLDNGIPDTLNVVADPTRFNQIFNNLLSNAIKFTHQGGITIKTFIEKETEKSISLHFIVKDTGIGIDEDKLVKIFHPFTQAYPETARKYGGTGLGLAITKNLVELQNGIIWVESQPGKGSSFHFTITYDKHKKSGPLKNNYEAQVRSDVFKDVKILVVEDNEINSFLTENVLKQWGCTVVVATNGNEAIDEVIKNDFDVILMDIQLPEKNGIQATEEIRLMEDDTKKNVPIIALTANALRGEEKKYTAAGMNDYLIKPFKEKELFNGIERVLIKNKPSYIKREEIEMPDFYMDSDEKLYDLGQVSEMAKGNSDFIVHLVNIYLETIPPIAEQMQRAIEAADGQQLSLLAHKLKSTIDTMNISSIRDDIRLLETKGKLNENITMLKPIVDKIQSVIRKVAEDLKVEYELQ